MRGDWRANLCQIPIANARAQTPARTQRVVAPIRGQSRAIATKVATISSGADWKISEKGEREMAKGYAWDWRRASADEETLIRPR